MLHLAGVAVAACGIAVAACRFHRDRDMVTQVLLAGIVINIAAYLVGTHAVLVANAREMAPVLPFAAALAGRQLAGPLLSGTRRRDAAAGTRPGAGRLPGRPWPGDQPPGRPATRRPAHRLAAGSPAGHRPVRLLGRERGHADQRRPVPHPATHRCQRESQPHRQHQQTWYDPTKSTADFVVLFPGIQGYPGFTSRSKVLASFGRPARTFHVGRYTILYWHKNLLTELP